MGKEFVSVRVPKIFAVSAVRKNGSWDGKMSRGAVYSLLTKEITQAEAIAAGDVEKALINKAIANGLYFPCKVAEKCLCLQQSFCFVLRNAKKINAAKKEERRRNTRKIALQSTRSEYAYLRQGFDVTRQARGRKYCSIACRQIAVKRRNEEQSIGKKPIGDSDPYLSDLQEIV